MKLKKYIYGKIKENRNILAIYTILSRIKNQDKEMIDLILTIEDRADYIKIEKHGEENPGRIIYVIHEMGRGDGFFAELKMTLLGLYYAERMGFIPYVEWGKNFAYYEPDGVNGIYNVFEYYFEPINTDIDISNCNAVSYSKNAQIAEIASCYGDKGYEISDTLEVILIDIWKRYIHIREDLSNDFEEQIKELFSNKKVLGVHYRGTDFKCGYNQHPVSVELSQVIEETKAMLEKNNIKELFLATDDIIALESFKEAFGEKVKYCEDVYRSDGNQNIAFSELERKQHHYRLGLEVLRDAYILSRCEYLIAGLSQVSFSSRLLKASRNESYCEMVIINNGINVGTENFKYD